MGRTDEISDIFWSGSESPKMSYRYDIFDILGSKCAEFFFKKYDILATGDAKKQNVEKYDISDILYHF